MLYRLKGDDFQMDQRTGPTVNYSRGVARRLRILQEYVGGKTNAEMGRLLDITPSDWGNMRTKRELSKTVAFRIIEKWPQITLEWLWLGKTDHLSPVVRRELEEIAQRIK